MLKVAILAFFLVGCAYAAEQTECQADRERRINSTVDATDSPLLHLIPDCDENGDYAALQCFTQKPWCVCYRRDGTNIGTPSRNIKACDCVRARDDARTNGDGYIPKCKRDGTYNPKQCELKSCWCVDEKGNALTDPTTDDVHCK